MSIGLSGSGQRIVLHLNYMQMAITEASKGGQAGEVPVGAVLTGRGGTVLSRAYNQSIGLCDPTAHAEILALRRAAATIQNYRLLNTTLYVTIEPCAMCMGAIIHARIARVVFGAKDPKWGAAGSVYDFIGDNRFNHQPEIISGICEQDCRELMVTFFRQKRAEIQRQKSSASKTVDLI